MLSIEFGKCYIIYRQIKVIGIFIVATLWFLCFPNYIRNLSKLEEVKEFQTETIFNQFTGSKRIKPGRNKGLRSVREHKKNKHY